jgi:hypothetical protein
LSTRREQTPPCFDPTVNCSAGGAKGRTVQDNRETPKRGNRLLRDELLAIWRDDAGRSSSTCQRPPLDRRSLQLPFLRTTRAEALPGVRRFGGPRASTCMRRSCGHTRTGLNSTDDTRRRGSSGLPGPPTASAGTRLAAAAAGIKSGPPHGGPRQPAGHARCLSPPGGEMRLEFLDNVPGGGVPDAGGHHAL